jgi:hypothetical protein
LQKSYLKKWHAEGQRAQRKIIYSTMGEMMIEKIIADSMLRGRGRREK